MTQYSSYSNIVSATTWTAGEVIIRAGNTVAWYDSSDLTTITKNANLVSAWNDKLASGHNLSQAGADNLKPIWSATGITFDGSNDYLKTGTFTYSQPNFIYAVLSQITWTHLDVIFDGYDASHRMCLFQYSLTPKIYLYAGTVDPSNAGLNTNIFAIIRILFNGSSSKLIINNGTPATGNPGVQNGAGFTLGSDYQGLTAGNIQVKELILRNVSDSAPNQTAIYNYLAVKYGFATI